MQSLTEKARKPTASSERYLSRRMQIRTAKTFHGTCDSTITAKSHLTQKWIRLRYVEAHRSLDAMRQLAYPPTYCSLCIPSIPSNSATVTELVPRAFKADSDNTMVRYISKVDTRSGEAVCWDVVRFWGVDSHVHCSAEVTVPRSVPVPPIQSHPRSDAM